MPCPWRRRRAATIRVTSGSGFFAYASRAVDQILAGVLAAAEHQHPPPAEQRRAEHLGDLAGATRTRLVLPDVGGRVGCPGLLDRCRRPRGRRAAPRRRGRAAAARRMSTWSRRDIVARYRPEQQCSLLRVGIRSLNAKPDISVIRNAVGNVPVLDQARMSLWTTQGDPPTSDLFHRCLCGHSARTRCVSSPPSPLGRCLPADRPPRPASSAGGRTRRRHGPRPSSVSGGP